ncbi:hypothetical protein F4680DRAFT_247681 [Xylaria scruposa]|nr:hypothetical protein F4680DRAFT_247681 [Xylaria scruposa]
MTRMPYCKRITMPALLLLSLPSGMSPYWPVCLGALVRGFFEIRGRNSTQYTVETRNLVLRAALRIMFQAILLLTANNQERHSFSWLAKMGA